MIKDITTACYRKIKNFNYFSLKFKIIASLLVAFLIIIAAVSSMNVLSSRLIKEKIYSSVENNIIQTNRYLGFLLKNAENICFALSTNGNLEELSNYYKNDERNYFDIYTLRRNLSKDIMFQAEINGQIDSIYVNISNIKAIITSKFGDFNYNETENYNYTKEIENLTTPYKWATYYDYNISNKKYISVICNAQQLRPKVKSSAYISVNYSEDVICNVINSLKMTPNSIVFLMDKTGTVISTEDKELISALKFNKNDIDINDIKENEIIKTKLGAKLYFLIQEKSVLPGYNILLLLPEDELLRELIYFQSRFIIFCILAFPIILFLIKKIVVKYVDQPVANLVSFMKKVEQGNFDIRINDDKRDEFGYLFRALNNMVEKIKRLIDELYEQQLLKREMELKVLKKQIDPHFLYNTLDTVNWIAQAHKINEISDIVVSLSNMYKTTFNRGRELIKCGEMADGLKSYLSIQKIRFGNSFDYLIEIDEGLNQCFILNLLIQTIVENAVVHGIGDCRKSRFINVCGRKVDKNMVFSVEDNGNGMSEEKLELLNLIINNEKIEEESGLKNVQKRVKLYYGEEYGLKIESTLNKGTKVTLLIPCVTKEVNKYREGDVNDKYFNC